MINLRNPVVKLVASIALIATMFTALGAAAPAPASGGPHAATTHQPGMMPGATLIVAHPGHIKQYSCTYEQLGFWNEYPGGNHVYVQPFVYNCSGNQYVDSIEWSLATGGGVQLNQWWFYSSCGNWFSSASGSPYTYLASSGSYYFATIGKNVPSQWNFDIDTSYNPGGTISQCM